MKTDELAFFNQQLAAMLREGIPLEGALSELVKGMRRGQLRDQLGLLQADLERGVPMREALEKRELPAFYRRMIIAGASAQDLPAMLTLLADYYNRSHATWARLKGLMVYPVIVMVVAFALSAILGILLNKLFFVNVAGVEYAPSQKNLVMASLWASPTVIGLGVLVCLSALGIPSIRAKARWKLPAFRDASLSQLSSAMAIMLKNGIPLPEAIRLGEMLESGTPVETALAEWREQIASGKGKPADWKQSSDALPPLFLWLIRSSGDDLGAGFQKAADLYGTRSIYRTELMLYGVLPLSVLLLGQMILWQVVPAIHFLGRMMNMIGS